MKNTFGNSISITLFGESHGSEIGAVLDGLPGGIKVDEEFIKTQLDLRRPSGDFATSRREKDNFRIVSGVFNGYTTGTPICIIIPNKDANSEIYEENKYIMRPSHGDYTAYCKYHGFQDYRGGGHFSGRLTCAIVAAGAILLKALNDKGIYIGTHIKSLANINDKDFSFEKTEAENEIKALEYKSFPVLCDSIENQMKAKMTEIKMEKDSIGGVLETAVCGLQAGLGEPWFDSMESMLSHAMFSIPAIKGIEFGEGFNFANLKGSEANDEFYFENDRVLTKTNHNGGINGGITNGMNLLFRCAVKPTPSIEKMQNTVDISKKENVQISIKGRHDSAIIQRIKPVVDSMTALVLADALAIKYGTDFFGENR